MGHSPGGFRVWWRRWHGDSDADLDDAHLMRLPGRFARRVRAWAAANAVPVIECKAGQRKHQIAEEYLASHSVGPGVFLVLVARAPATVWKVRRSPGGVIMALEKKTEYVNHYSFHIMNRNRGTWSSRCPGTRPSARRSSSTATSTSPVPRTRPGSLSRRRGTALPGSRIRAAWPRSQRRTLVAGRGYGPLGRACDRWIYTACLCFGLDLADQQAGFATTTRSTRPSTAGT